ncbi:GDT1-like protein C17G8.08c [Psilocybe cubensis]|uniref:GDT1 family protein n=2 Tax=Psilocybe cubensis TaxID=181762 RepID=A0A8H8CEY5_PSICU|nr:GDT1-like protein C17G8.08c [Psilocybe cubensis]KAH9483364.1 GDT1-like protein C17G8.08c [Psilocybe cubensis]
MALPNGYPTSSIQAFAQSFSMIIVSEIGDKTFLIAAILAMRHLRLAVFLGAFLSLFLMSFLSASLGQILPALIPRGWTQWCASALFLIFGMKMWNEAKEMESGTGKIEEEMREAEEDIEGDQWKHESRRGDLGNQRTGSYPPESMEKHGRKQGSNSGLSTSKMRAKTSWMDETRSVCSLLFGPVFVQAFVLTFLAEWGDRSQIATIILGAAHVRIPVCLLLSTCRY